MDEDEYQAALARGALEREFFATECSLVGTDIFLALRNGTHIVFPTSHAKSLVGQPESVLRDTQLIGAGSMLEFCSLGIVFYVPALARGVFGPEA